MCTAEMPRKNAGYRLDERCISALKVLAERTGVSVNEYLEKLLFEHAKVQQVIPSGEERLGETRGRKKTDGEPEVSAKVKAKRSGAGKPPKGTPTADPGASEGSPSANGTLE
jgi:hypothetical protein